MAASTVPLVRAAPGIHGASSSRPRGRELTHLMGDSEGRPEVGEAAVADTPTGRVPQGEGWFVVNVGELSWERHPASGVWCSFEAPDAPFAQYGIGVHVLEPGQASGLYLSLIHI